MAQKLVGGTSRPSIFAVLGLIASSYLQWLRPFVNVPWRSEIFLAASGENSFSASARQLSALPDPAYVKPLIPVRGVKPARVSRKTKPARGGWRVRCSRRGLAKRGFANSAPPAPCLSHQKPPVCPPTDTRPRAWSQRQQARQVQRSQADFPSPARRLCPNPVHATTAGKFKLRYYRILGTIISLPTTW